MTHSVQENSDEQSQFTYHFADFILLRLASLPTNIIDQPVMSDTTAIIEQRLTLEAEWEMLALHCNACINEILIGCKKEQRKDLLPLLQAIRKNKKSRFVELCEKSDNLVLQHAKIQDFLTLTKRITCSVEKTEWLFHHDFNAMINNYYRLLDNKRFNWLMESERMMLNRLKKQTNKLKVALTIFKYITRISLKTSPYQRYMGLSYIELKLPLYRNCVFKINQWHESCKTSKEWQAIQREEYRRQTLNQGDVLLRINAVIGMDGMVESDKQKLVILRDNLWFEHSAHAFLLKEPLLSIFQTFKTSVFTMTELLQKMQSSGISQTIAKKLFTMFLEKGLLVVESSVPEVYAEGQGQSSHPLALHISEKQQVLWLDCQLGYSSDRIKHLQHVIASALKKNVVASIEHYILLRFYREQYQVNSNQVTLEQFVNAINENQSLLSLSLNDEDILKQCNEKRITAGVGELFVNVKAQVFTEDEREKLILNGVYEFPIWQISRYTAGNSLHEQYMRQSIVQWLKGENDHRVIGLSIGSECNSLQDHHGIVDEYLQGFVSNSQELAATTVSPGDLFVRVSPHGDRLEVVDKFNQRVQLINIGGIVPLPNWGAHYWLPYLTSPLAIKRPNKGLDWSQNQDALVHRPRESIDDCVLYRETWTCDAKKLYDEIFLPCPPGKQVDAECLYRVKKVFCTLGIPAQCFVQKVFTTDWRSVNSLADRHRKPQWIDINNPLALTLLAKILQDAHIVKLQEVLPASVDRLQTAEGDTYVSELHFELKLSW
ncbi:MAG: hypothetical protein ACRDCA_19105 [Serratia sp. (in: enterobacteria)]|uniref:hypothetical protein n=1 Tax=Serratia sp. (in: enterobacteria) TaxID=616 RepID=UPI003F3B9859